MLPLLRRLTSIPEQPRMDFLNYELVVPRNRLLANFNIKKKQVDLDAENLEFKAFLLNQRTLIKKLNIYQSLRGAQKNKLIDKHASVVLQLLYNIRENNYFIFYFGNNQFGMCFILNWFEVVLKSEMSFHDTKTALNTVAFILRTSRNLNITDDCKTITSQCKCLPDWAVYNYQKFFTDILFDVHSLILLLQNDNFLGNYHNDPQLTLSIFDLINYLVYFVPQQVLVKSKFINDSIDYMLIHNQNFQVNFLNTLNLIISTIYHKDLIHNEVVSEQVQHDLTHSLKKSLIFFLDASAKSAVSSEFTLKLLSIVFGFCIMIENSSETCAQKELYTVSNEVFTNYLMFLRDILDHEPFNKLHINLLLSYLQFLAPLLNNQMLSDRVTLIPILINILQLTKSNLLFYESNQTNNEVNSRLSLKLRSIVYFKKRREIKRIAERIVEFDSREKKADYLFATDHVLNEIKSILRTFQTDINEWEKVYTLIQDLIGLLLLI